MDGVIKELQIFLGVCLLLDFICLLILKYRGEREVLARIRDFLVDFCVCIIATAIIVSIYVVHCIFEPQYIGSNRSRMFILVSAVHLYFLWYGYVLSKLSSLFKNRIAYYSNVDSYIRIGIRAPRSAKSRILLHRQLIRDTIKTEHIKSLLIFYICVSCCVSILIFMMSRHYSRDIISTYRIPPGNIYFFKLYIFSVHVLIVTCFAWNCFSTLRLAGTASNSKTIKHMEYSVSVATVCAKEAKWIKHIEYWILLKLDNDDEILVSEEVAGRIAEGDELYIVNTELSQGDTDIKSIAVYPKKSFFENE